MSCQFGLHSMFQKFMCSAQWRTRPLGWALTAGLAVAGAALVSTAAAQAVRPPAASPAPAGTQTSYPGIWYDDTGQGAVEIGPCGDRLCGRIVWLRAPTDKAGRPLTDALNPDNRRRNRAICGLDVIGDLKRQSNGAWDEGWIYDPKQGKQFDVELKLRAVDLLQVTGYLGLKFLSETFLWKRAPVDLKRCTT